MAESPSAGCELQDENGKKLFSCLKIQGIHLCHIHGRLHVQFSYYVFVNTILDVPPLEDMSELIQQVNKLREDVSSGQSSEQSTKTSATKPKSEPSAQVILYFTICPNIGPFHLLSAFINHLFHLLILPPVEVLFYFTSSQKLTFYTLRKEDQSADTPPIPHS